MEVELDIFSGVPNPSWTLPPTDAKMFLQRFSALPKVSARKLSGNLGYRGFIVALTQDAEEYLVRVQTGTVQVTRGSRIMYYRDPGRKLERWLLESGERYLDRELSGLVRRELTG